MFGFALPSSRSSAIMDALAGSCMSRRITSEVLNVRRRIILEKSTHSFPPGLDHRHMQRTASGLVPFIDQQTTQLGFPQNFWTVSTSPSCTALRNRKVSMLNDLSCPLAGRRLGS